MTVLLLADHDNKALSAAVPKAMSAAKALGQDVHVLVAAPTASPLRRLPPSSRVLPRCSMSMRRILAISWPKKWLRSSPV